MPKTHPFRVEIDARIDAAVDAAIRFGGYEGDDKRVLLVLRAVAIHACKAGFMEGVAAVVGDDALEEAARQQREMDRR